MLTYIKYNPVDEATFPEEGMPVLCAVFDRKYNDWGVYAGFYGSFTMATWNEQIKEVDIYWQKVILPVVDKEEKR